MNSITNNRALLVGVGADLPSTVTDAEGLTKILTDPSRCQYPPANVAVLTEGNAARDRVLAALDALATPAVADATVLIYYSGHGYRVTSSVGENYYLMTHGYDLARLYQTAISGREWADRLAAIPAKRLLLLLDCCHAGGLTAERTKAVGLTFAKAPLPPEAEALFTRGQGRIRIASSRADEFSLAGTPYSLFTRALIESLSGQGVARQDGYVRALDLALHAREKVPQWSGQRQTPIVDVEAADNFVVAYYAAGAKSPLPLDLPPVDPEEVARLNDLAGAAAATTRASVIGGGAIAQGRGAQAAGERGVVIGGSVDRATIITGDRIDTGGGAFIGGNVNTGGGTFVGHDQYNTIPGPPDVGLAELRALVAELGRLLRQAKLPADIGEIVESDFKQIERQVEQDAPKGAIVKSRLGSLKELLSGAETATGLGERIVAVLGKAAQLAGLLFP
ncbi:MAG: caspase family protein [Candidatus Contendobacter sp.]|nr:caspase family protein [Candidatus Contendobacter sp.]